MAKRYVNRVCVLISSKNGYRSKSNLFLFYFSLEDDDHNGTLACTYLKKKINLWLWLCLNSARVIEEWVLSIFGCSSVETIKKLFLSLFGLATITYMPSAYKPHSRDFWSTKGLTSSTNRRWAMRPSCV